MRRVSWKGIQRRTKSAQRQTKVVARCPIEAMTAGRAACVFTGDQRLPARGLVSAGPAPQSGYV